MLALGHLRYHEVDELRAGVKRTVGDRRNRIANNLRVRRASVALSKASDLNELFDAMKLMLEFEEFAYASVELGQSGNTEMNKRAFRASEHRRQLHGIEFRDGRIVWSWKRDGVNEDEVVGSSAFSCFRLPLSTESSEWGWMSLYRPLDGPPLLLDMNYLAGFFRTDLAQAAGRILQSFEKPVDAGELTAGNTAMTMTAGKTAG